ncbi:hypothetical protein pb186bvf_005885 [Paramecium bursaria]
MNELSMFEEMKSKEIKLIQQVYEQKIHYLDAKIALLMKDLNQKDQRVRELEGQQQSVIDQRELEKERSAHKQALMALQIEKEAEFNKFKTQCQQEIQNYQNALKNKESIIQQLQNEIQFYKSNSLKQMDEAKIQYLSQIIDLTQELSQL